MKIKMVLLAIITLGLFSACATTPQPEGASSPTPLGDGKGRIVVYRVGKFFGYAQRSDVLLNGVKIGRSVPGEKFHTDTVPGLHHLSIPNMDSHGERALEVTVKNGETIYVKTWLGGSAFAGRTNLVIVSESLGSRESAGLNEQRD